MRRLQIKAFAYHHRVIALVNAVEIHRFERHPNIRVGDLRKDPDKLLRVDHRRVVRFVADCWPVGVTQIPPCSMPHLGVKSCLGHDSRKRAIGHVENIPVFQEQNIIVHEQKIIAAKLAVHHDFVHYIAGRMLCARGVQNMVEAGANAFGGCLYGSAWAMTYNVNAINLVRDKAER